MPNLHNWTPVYSTSTVTQSVTDYINQYANSFNAVQQAAAAQASAQAMLNSTSQQLTNPAAEVDLSVYDLYSDPEPILKKTKVKKPPEPIDPSSVPKEEEWMLSCAKLRRG